MASSTSNGIRIADPKDPEYQDFRRNTDLREPYRLPKEVLRGVTTRDGFDVPESPLIAFINPRSGGRAGPQLLEKLFLALGNGQVFDLKDFKPDFVLGKIWDNLGELDMRGDERPEHLRQRFKICACGGDGTVAWVMKVIKQLNISPQPAVAIVPLGTGNDLSRTFKWGRTFKPKWIKNTKAVYTHLKEISDGYYRELDSWHLKVTSPDPELYKAVPKHMLSPTENPKVREGMAWNYVSVGMDAQAAYSFHHLRETHPALAFGRLINQFWYGVFSLTSGWGCCSPSLATKVSLKIMKSDQSWVDVEIPSSVKALVLLNLQSYAGGRNLWGTGLEKKDKERGIHEPRFDDCMFEVVGLKNLWHTSLVMAGLAHGIRIAQCSGARLELKTKQPSPEGEPGIAYMQLDGEPWPQYIPSKKEDAPLVVEMTYWGKNLLLMNQRKMKKQDYPADPKKPLETRRSEPVTKSTDVKEVELVAPAPNRK